MSVTQGFSARQGTDIWGLNTFRSFLLTKMLEDLEQLEIRGLDDDQCKLVKKCLGEIIQEFDRFPEDGFAKSIVRDQLVEFLDIYSRWNDVNNEQPGARTRRRTELQRLRRRRQKLSKKIGRKQVALSTEIDDKFFNTLWNSLEKIPNEYPGEFKRLSAAINRSRAVLNRGH